MRDGWALVLAAAAALGASRPQTLPVLAVVVLVLVALRLRRPAVLCVGVALLASGLSQRAWAGLDGVEPRLVAGEVLLLSDPEPAAGGVRADVRVGHTRLELRGAGGVAGALRERAAGERLIVRGEVDAAPAGATWFVPRHIAGVLTVHRIDAVLAARQPYAAANALRSVLARGAAPLTIGERSLFTGLVIGDDRAQSATMTDAFRGAAMTHLLAVSGQNVAFVLVLIGPVARRLRLWPRLAVVLAVVGLFGCMTRFEPSVLRASAMAALAALTMTIGSPVPRLRLLALAVTALLLVDPLLVHSVGFQLSVLAAAAIVVLAAPIAAVLPGPAWLAEPLGITVAAQLGVAPVLLATFGPVPVASFPANLLAVPVAGLVMVWGLTAGMIAGAAGGWVAELVHLPTRVLLGWIEAVAERAAAAPLGELHAVHLGAVALGLGISAAARSRGGRAVRRCGLGLAGAAVVAAVLVAHAPPPLRSVPRAGVVRWHAGDTDVVALGGGGWRTSLGVASVLEELRRAGVGSIDVLVLVDTAVPEAVVEAVRARHPTGAVLVPSSGTDVVPGAVTVPPAGTELEVGGLHVTVVPGEGRLVVEARPRGTPR